MAIKGVKDPVQLREEFEQVLSVLEKVARRGHSSAMAQCPAHEDTDPSLSVDIGKSAVLFRCFAGCDQAAVLAAIRARQNGTPRLTSPTAPPAPPRPTPTTTAPATPKATSPPRDPTPKRIVEIYRYENLDRESVLEVVRF